MKLLQSASIIGLFSLALAKSNYVCPGGYEIAEEAVQAAAEKVDRHPKKTQDSIRKTENTLHITLNLDNKTIDDTEYSISARIFTPDNTIRVFETETKSGKQGYCGLIAVNEEDDLSYDESFEAELSDDDSEDADLSNDDDDDDDDDDDEEEVAEGKPKTH
ncbi:unnamed protein product [Blumeria hordei]|uniref:Uncharacterized protein n=1 Tax=Blumeria hordei TaxID=2867405 RepID=A0A383V1G9_BLUHO|nr:unnamed protein product [Blumeria hordei]